MSARLGSDQPSNLMFTRVDLEARVSIAALRNIHQILRQKIRNRASLLVLVDMPKLVGDQASVHTSLTDEDPVAQGQANAVFSNEVAQPDCLK